MIGDVVWCRWQDLRILAMPRVRFQNRPGREHESVLIINPPARATNSEAVAQIIATRFAPCAIIRPIYSHSRKTLVSRKQKHRFFGISDFGGGPEGLIASQTAYFVRLINRLKITKNAI